MRGRTLAAALLALASIGRLASGGDRGGFSTGAGSAAAFEGRTMGTYWRVRAAGDETRVPLAARAAAAAFARVDSLMSNWTTTSEVARINREAAHGAIVVHPEVARVLEAALRVWRDSGGVYDVTIEPLVRAWGFLGGRPRVPPDSEAVAAWRRVGAQQLRFDHAARTLTFERDGVAIDLGGIAKGYAVDVAAESVRAHGVRAVLVEISGNLVALGRGPRGDAWRIGIRDPRDRMPYFARLAVRDQAVSTSGAYEQFVAADGRTYGHIMDPRTGRPAAGLISVTVVAATALDADAWDTPLFVLGGPAARRLAKARVDFAAVLVSPGATVDTVWIESDLADRFVLEPRARGRFEVRHF